MNKYLQHSRVPREDDIESLAAAWLARRHAGLSPAEEQELRAWLEADVEHRTIFSEFETTWKTLAFPAGAGMAQVAANELTRRQRRRGRRNTRRLMCTVVAAAAAAVLFAWRPHDPLTTPASPIVTIAAHPDQMTLADGTLVELNANAEVSVAYTASQRAVQLLQGEALFTVSADPTRPFVVTAGRVSVRAVGTAFSVRRSVTNVDVMVTEGSVAVETDTTPPAAGVPNVDPEPVAAATLVVEAGARVSVPVVQPRSAAIAVVRVSSDEVERALAWRGKRIEFTRTPLAEAIAVFNRENRLQLSLATAALGEFRISGIFWADDPEGFIRLLESGFGVESQREGDAIVLR